ncbi:hypothetical protein N7499_003093 [Penicillium canescens]|uniref:Uncharacterized protein n=1 Tax=Penicillium canescens TaxID=5083 RepID=A0AAD6N829_PENCN|nr:uncharacterized protein N7446_011965 [Penicillium canescens]KAJ6019806.1 hypothetical protein N7522_000514 [Penicillium canescens]KAJ6039099.1 hypothetical protein N7460_007131 [Penicillium canescens]KAJ6047131.1 hypothetical protein N7446_011965 [Penicillium canescens]KAJ6059883.1 hypothetical protein N7444_003522 [Penicillium canescens]KAJ6093762.1 hypothetical protein N7499_003093 [Penicillium canescens]
MRYFAPQQKSPTNIQGTDRKNESKKNETHSSSVHGAENLWKRFSVRIFSVSSEHTSENVAERLLDDGRSSRWDAKMLDTWFYEICALCFSTLCFVAILCVLRVYDQKPTPKLSNGLTLNTVISVLATASKSSLIYVVGESIGQLKWIFFHTASNPLSYMQAYDSASRGPWGSLMILFKDKGRSLVTIGALITILALVFDPFVQQVLTYPVRETMIQSDSVMTERSRNLMPGDNNVDFTDAINIAFWTDNFSSNPTCPSGNCTWPPFLSVDLCRNCEDITLSAELVGCEDVPFNTSLNANQSVVCSVSVPQGRWASVPFGILPLYGNDPSLEESDLAFVMFPPKDIVWTVDRLFPDSRYLPNKTYSGSHPESGLKISKVTQCALSLCARTYNVSVSGGNPNIGFSTPDYGMFSISDPFNLNDICWKPHGMGPPVKDNQFQGSFKNETEFAFCPALILLDYDLQLHGTSAYTLEWRNSDPGWLFRRLDQPSSPNMQKIITLGLEKVTENLAASITKFGRTIGNETVTGIMAINQSFVTVHWQWLTLPALLIILGIVLLLSTIHFNKTNLWGNSSLAALYHGLESGPVAENDSLSGMEQTASKVKARLGISETSGALVLQIQNR